MKYLLMLFLLISGNCFAGTDYTQDASTLSAYLFSEGTGTTTDNAEGTASRDGTFKGTGEPAWDATLPSGYTGTYSVDFDGSDDYINCSNTTFTNSSTSISITAWIYLGSKEGKQTIVNNGDSDQIWFVFDKSGNDKLNVYLGRSSSKGYHNSNTTVGRGAWHHVAITYNASTLTFYLDGSADGTASTTQTANFNATSRPSQIGNDHDTHSPFDGLIAEVGIFERALTSTEINNIMDDGLDGTQGGVVTFIPYIIIY